MSLEHAPAREGGVEPLVVSVKTAAQMLELGQSTIWLMLADGRLKGTLIGRSRRIYLSSIKQVAGLQ